MNRAARKAKIPFLVVLLTLGLTAGSVTSFVVPAEARWVRRCHYEWHHHHRVRRCERVWSGHHHKQHD